MKENVKELLTRVLLKKAKGYLVREKTDEYAVNTEGEKKLIKSKVVTKRAPPDVAACKVLLELDVNELDLTDMTDEQLKAERDRLIRLLSDCDNEDNELQKGEISNYVNTD